MKFTPKRLQRVGSAIFVAAGCAEAEAELVARYLVKANLVGHDSHGIIRVPQYVQQLAEGRIQANQSPTVVSDAGAAVILDGNLGFGQVMGEQAVIHGLAKARQHGVSLVGLRNVAHLGRIGDWAELAAEAGVISLHFVNILDAPWVAPFGGRERRLSTNPLACGIPAADGPPVIADFATCAVAEGKIRVARNKGLKLPEGSILDREGRPSTNPQDVYEGGAILPIAGHKGHALAIIVDLLAGTLSGGGSANPEVTGNRSNMLSLFVDPGVFADADAVARETGRFVEWIKSSAPVDPDG
ncbi:MAG: Ldh family oxidoreductase, partial [Kiloniellales bacterium]